MKHIKPINLRAESMERRSEEDVRGMQLQIADWMPYGCTTNFDPGWEIDWSGTPAGLCNSMERDLYGCSGDCWWPAANPDEINLWAGRFHELCAAATRDWRKLPLFDYPDLP